MRYTVYDGALPWVARGQHTYTYRRKGCRMQWLRKHPGRSLLIGLVCVCLLAIIHWTTLLRPENTHGMPDPISGINDAGESYGIGSSLENNNDPDLILAEATNGLTGYVRATDLEGGDPPSSPEEAVKSSYTPDRQIPVYESDGKTVIGYFVVEGYSK